MYSISLLLLLTPLLAQTNAQDPGGQPGAPGAPGEPGAQGGPPPTDGAASSASGGPPATDGPAPGAPSGTPPADGAAPSPNGEAPAPGAMGGPDLTKYPEWITNDYQCVIGCLSGFNDTIKTIPQAPMETAAYTCAASNCAGDGTGNWYQTLYYIQLFYATGSIYEWAESAPDGYKKAEFTFGDEGEAPQASASEAVATASDPWSADLAESTGGAGSNSSGVSTAPGITSSTSSGSASHTASSAKSSSPTSSAAHPAGTGKNGSTNGTDGDNTTSGALPVYDVGVAGMGVQGLIGMVVGVVSLAFGGVITGL